jgi:hypothetical protein
MDLRNGTILRENKIDKPTEKKDNTTMSNKTEPIEDSPRFIIVKINENSERAFIPLLYSDLPNRVKVYSSIKEAKKTIEGAAIALGIDIEWNTEYDSYICETTDLVDAIRIEIWRI